MEPIILPSLDISRPYEPTLYMDEESMKEDLDKSIAIIITAAIICKILKSIK